MKALAAASLASRDLGTSSAEVRRVWRLYFPDIPLSDTRWFEKYEATLVRKGIRIAAENKQNGKKFKALDEENLGKYVMGIIRNLKLGKRVEGPSFVVKAEFCFEADYQITPKDRARFAKKLIPVGECLLFGGTSTAKKYPKFSIGGRTLSAHFFAFFARLGWLPKSKGLGGVNGLQVAHTCGNPSCCHRDHLRLMTKELNLKERRSPSAGGPVSAFHCAPAADYGSSNAMTLSDPEDTSTIRSIDKELGQQTIGKPVAKPNPVNSLNVSEESLDFPWNAYKADDVRPSARLTEVTFTQGDITI